MSRLATSFVLGYHGCEKAVGLRAISGDAHIGDSYNKYDWLGSGAYFWEADPRRALEWALKKKKGGSCKEPFVVGAIIDLRNCLDLLSRDDLEDLREAHSSFLITQKKTGEPVPENKSPKGQKDKDRPLRYLDCAVIEHLHSLRKIPSDPALQFAPFDTVRGLFTEGEELFPGSGFARRSHVQIAVRSKECILGYFLPKPYPSENASF